MNKRSNLGDNQKRLNSILNQIKELVNEKGQLEQNISYEYKTKTQKEQMINFIKNEYLQLCEDVRNLQMFRKRKFGSPPRNQ